MIDNKLKVSTKFAGSGQSSENLRARVNFDGGDYRGTISEVEKTKSSLS